jgi:hypothetical protein
MNSQLHC